MMLTRDAAGFVVCAIAVLAIAWASGTVNQAGAQQQGFGAQILRFTADPSTIHPGESVSLEWAVVNSDRVTIDHRVGNVAARGNRIVKPSETTTYTLFAHGYRSSGNDTRSVTVTVADTPAASAQSSR
jgi:hypothetical protein